MSFFIKREKFMIKFFAGQAKTGLSFLLSSQLSFFEDGFLYSRPLFLNRFLSFLYRPFLNFWRFGGWSFFGFWDLGFGIFCVLGFGFWDFFRFYFLPCNDRHCFLNFLPCSHRSE